MSIRTGIEMAVILALCIGLFLAKQEAAQLGRQVADRDATIAQQTKAVELAKQTAATANANAETAALRALARSRVKRENIVTAGAGPEEMNRWFTEALR